MKKGKCKEVPKKVSLINHVVYRVYLCKQWTTLNPLTSYNLQQKMPRGWKS